MEDDFSRLGPYVLLRVSGAGGMARLDVALRSTPAGSELCVLKRMHADFRSPEQEARFRREAEIAARLSHDAIARTIGTAEVDGEPLLLQELIMGVDLRRLVGRVAAVGERLPVPLALYVACEVARALDYAHGFGNLGIVHRDVTPDNIMLAFSGKVKLVDFGIARSNADSTLTETGLVVGRPVYTAPEVWEGARADRRADVYSLGVVLWQLLTGRPADPPNGASGPAELPPNLPEALAAVAQRALAANPAERLQTAGKLREALARFLPPAFDGRTVLASLLARHFDVERERTMLAEDVARARRMLPPPAAPKTLPARQVRRPPRTRFWVGLTVAIAGSATAAGVHLAHRGQTVRLAGPSSAQTGGRLLPIAAPAHAATSTTAPGTSAASTPGTSAPHSAGASQLAAAPLSAAAPKSVAVAPEAAAPHLPVASARSAAVPVATSSAAAAAAARTLVDRGQASFDRGELDLALALGRRAAAAGAGAPAYVLVGTVMMNRHRYADAEQAFAEAAREAPGDAKTARLLAMVQEIRKIGDASP